MKSREYKRGFNGDEPYDELWGFIASEDGEAKLEELDSHWNEVMEIAEKYGFIMQAAGGTAMLSTHSVMADRSIDGEAKRLRMCNVELGDE